MWTLAPFLFIISSHFVCPVEEYKFFFLFSSVNIDNKQFGIYIRFNILFFGHYLALGI